MYPLNDKDLDRLSREAAEQYDVESSASGWDLVENRLNTEMPVKAEKERRRFLFWLFFIALMAGGGLVFMLGGNKSSTSIAQSHQSPTSAVSSKDQSTTSNLPDNTTVDKTNTAVASQTEKNTKDISADKSAKSSTSTSIDNTETLGRITKKVPGKGGEGLSKDVVKYLDMGTQPTKTRRKTNVQGELGAVLVNNKGQLTHAQKVRSNTGRNKPANDGKLDIVEDDPVVTNKTNSAKKDGIENNAEKITGNSSVIRNQEQKDVAASSAVDKGKVEAPAASNATAQKESTDNNVDKTDKKTAELTASVKKPNSKSATPIKNPLEIGIVAGPDQSYVKFKSGDNTGINLGVQVGYRFSNRWSVNTGIILEKKNYRANGEDFTSPKNDWTRYVKMNSVDGTCSMFDIPLNVRYDFSYNDKRRLFVSTGLTSYLMHHQAYDYYYNYPPPGGPNQVKNWATDSSMNYFLSVLNLSVGFERTLSKHFSFQVEPYLKIPLKGVGYGSLKMDSYGAFFSLKYKPSLGKKSK